MVVALGKNLKTILKKNFILNNKHIEHFLQITEVKKDIVYKIDIFTPFKEEYPFLKCLERSKYV